MNIIVLRSKLDLLSGYKKKIIVRIFKSSPVLTIVNSYLVDSPQPSTISYMWNFGSLLGLCLISQIISGILLAMHYQGSASFAFLSVEHIMRDVQNGWLIRMAHANIASFFFIFVYLHISRGLYYGSYRSPRMGVWVTGTIIFFLMMATAFLGYVLPYGQMSLWGATVITNLLSAIPWLGKSLVESIKIENYENLLIISNYAFVNKSWLDHGNFSSNNYKAISKRLLEKSIYLNIKRSFLALYVGIIDGAGVINLNYNYKGKKLYIREGKLVYNNVRSLTISLDIKLLSILYEIQSVLPIGKITKSKRNCKLVIYKKELVEILFPLLIYHNLFFLTNTTVINYYLALMLSYGKNKSFNDFDKEYIYRLNSNDFNLSSKGLLSLDFFNDWLVGYTLVRGSFEYENKEPGFYNTFTLKYEEVSNLHQNLLEAIALKFKKRWEKEDETEKIIINNMIYKKNYLTIWKKEDIQEVIFFFNSYSLLGIKQRNYDEWIKFLKISDVSNEFKFSV